MDSRRNCRRPRPRKARAQTIRANFDDTLTPTLLLHLGVGLLYFDQNQYPPSFNAGQILGWGAEPAVPREQHHASGRRLVQLL